MAGVNEKRTKRAPKNGRDNPDQSERFIQAAKELAAEDGEAFERAMAAMLKPKKNTPPNS